MRGLGFAASLFAVLFSYGATAGETETSSPAYPGWSLGASLDLGTHIQRFSAESTTSFSFAVDASKSVVSATIGARIEVLAPSFESLPGRPRPFLQVGGQLPTATDKRLAEAGAIGPIVIPGNPAGIDPNDIGGQGSDVRADYDLFWFFGVGLDFEIPIGSRKFHVRPSVDYFGETIQMEGLIVEVIEPIPDVFQTLRISESKQVTLHALGPRLAIELSVLPPDPWGVDVFLESRLYWLVGARSARFGKKAFGGFADYKVRSERWISQVSAGIRVTWSGGR